MAHRPSMKLVVLGKEKVSHLLNKDLWFLGRVAGNDVVLNSPTVSGHHARLFFTPEGWRIRDLKSRNGLSLKGVKGEEFLLEPGDEIKLGDVILRLEPAAEDSPPPEDSLALAAVPFSEQSGCPNSGKRRAVTEMIEALVAEDPTAEDLDHRLALSLRREFGAEGVFFFSVVGGAGARQAADDDAVCKYEASSEGAGATILSHSTLREALRQKSPLLSPVELAKPGRSLKGLTGAQILIYPLLAGQNVMAILYMDWGRPSPELIPAMRELASWPVWATLLLGSVWGRRALAARVEEETRHQENLSQAFRRQIDPGEILGNSLALKDSLALAAAAAPSPYPILLLGETGVGKEVFARWIHLNSACGGGPFVAVNCAGIPAGTAESELFGHRRGAFTGADRDHAGVFEQAEGGTLLLDEIGDMDLAMQAKVLRAIQFGVVRRLGDDRERRVAVRLIAATHQDLRAKIGEKTFREDLFYRLTTFELRLPPLRERSSDIALLASSFLAKAFKKPGTAAGFSPGAMRALREFSWPGNVRQLQSAVNHLSASAAESLIQEDDARRLLGLGKPTLHESPGEMGLLSYKHALERFRADYLRSVLDRAGGNAAEAARSSGLPRSTFYRLMERHPEAKMPEA